MVKPGGTGRPRLAISARLAPLPPNRSRSPALPSALPPPNEYTHLPAWIASCGAVGRLLATAGLLAADLLAGGLLVTGLAATGLAALPAGLTGALPAGAFGADLVTVLVAVLVADLATGFFIEDLAAALAAGFPTALR